MENGWEKNSVRNANVRLVGLNPDWKSLEIKQYSENYWNKHQSETPISSIFCTKKDFHN